LLELAVLGQHPASKSCTGGQDHPTASWTASSHTPVAKTAAAPPLANVSTLRRTTLRWPTVNTARWPRPPTPLYT